MSDSAAASNAAYVVKVTYSGHSQLGTGIFEWG